jgi:para-nitrobenzyl esterase
MNIRPAAVVNTQAGKIEGSFEKGLYVFKGIPYADPPVGDLRWMPPQPHAPWKAVRKAKSFGPIAPQPVMPLIPGLKLPGFSEVEPQNEDCLFLNIWTPGVDNAKRPVMVWIHGGAFVGGSGSISTYRGDALSSRGNTVLVTINYRMGLLGFLNLKEVTGGKIPATGNEGLLDQIAALQWVKDNIAAFGGDPQNVTVFGESAGGMSIGCLMVMPKARGLFQKAILESGVGVTARPLEPSVQVAHDFLTLVGLKSSDSAALKALPVEKIIPVQIEMTLKAQGGMTPVSPVIDGELLPVPLETIRAGLVAGIPAIIGTNRDEWKLFDAMIPDRGKMDEEMLSKRLSSMLPGVKVAELIEAYRDARAKRGEPTSPDDIAAAIQGDRMFRMAAVRVLEARVKNKQPTYSYMFTWKSPVMGGALGSCHALEIGFVFGSPDTKFCGSGPLADQLTNQMQDAWLSFARSGNPSCPSLGEWPQYGTRRQTMILGKESYVEDDPYQEERQIWDEVGGI